MYYFTEKTIVISGAAGHLGQAVVRASIAAGAQVGLLDYKSGRLGHFFPESTTTSNFLLIEGIDSANIEAMQTAINQVHRHFGKIDAFVNTVGGFEGGASVQDTGEDVLARMYRQHVQTVLAAAHAVAPLMEAQGSGVIVMVAAQSALKAGSRNGAYSAAKAAGLRLTESLASGLQKSGIRVYSVLPGTIDTPENRAQMPNADTSKWASAESIAEVILFLISDSARAISQVAIAV